MAERVQEAFRPTPRGVVGLVNDLLDLCRLEQLQINFVDGCCFVRRLGGTADETIALQIPKSVFRAALARIAALCEEQHPGTFTPYAGQGDITVPQPSCDNAGTKATCHVPYANTPAAQHLELRFSTRTVVDGARFVVLLRDNRTVTVVGHALKYMEHVSNNSDPGSYGIIARTANGEDLVALFRVSEVIGVFCGDITDPGTPGGLASQTSTVSTGREAQRQEAANEPSWPL